VVTAADPIELVPGSPEWCAEMTASKVAAVLGLSPWDSPYSLWYQMAGQVDRGIETVNQTRGHYLEPAVAAWVADQYDLRLTDGRCWRNRARPWQVASPDRLALDHPHGWTDDGPTANAVVEVKTAASWEQWGPDGSDEIPPYYRVQCIWQMDTLDLDTAYVGVLLPGLEFRGYILHPNPGEPEFIREQARAFLDSLAAGDPPDVDSHSQTYKTVRALNPDIEERDAEIPLDLAHRYRAAVMDRRAADVAEADATSRLALAMGTAHNAVVTDGDRTLKLAYRQTNGRGDPYVKAVKRLPDLPETLEET
jgi:putative phage-type endonuclease